MITTWAKAIVRVTYPNGDYSAIGYRTVKGAKIAYNYYGRIGCQVELEVTINA